MNEIRVEMDPKYIIRYLQFKVSPWMGEMI